MKRIPNMKRWGVILTAICLLAISLIAGCKKSDEAEGKVRDLDFNVVGQSEIPQELMEIINQKKAEPFRLTYSSGDALYIAAGYGEQKTGGYSISVPQLYLTDNSIVIKTELTGPEKAEQAGPAASYPFIVIRMEMSDKPVVFN